MIIIRFQGGLGNQLFQYALYKELQYLGREVYADLSVFKRRKEPREFELYKLGIVLDEADPKLVNRMCPTGKNIFAKIIKNTICRNRFIKEKNSFLFDSIFLERDNLYFIGYWQTEKYFPHIKEQLREEIKFPLTENNNNMMILEKIHSTNSVSVHMRFGDYVNNPIYDNICTCEYYIKAIQVMSKKYPDAAFYIISDDIERAKKVLRNDTYEYIDWNRGADSYYDMKLISQCKHNIIANSSFSWWGTWLNQNEEKTVIAPSIWLNHVAADDVGFNSWIRITPKGEVLHA